jgi:hypothetical protein
MQYQTEQLNALFKQGFRNEQRLRLAHRAGCYSCKEIFPTSEIVGWYDDEPCRTAECPRCHVDSVVPESPEFILTPELMKQMQAKFFPSEALLEDFDFGSFGSVEEIRNELRRLGVKIMVI